MKHKRYRVFVADDSIFIQNFIQTIFEKEAFVEIVGTASDGQETIERVPQLKPDLLILDLEMPRKNGLEVLEYLMENYPLPVLILSAYSEEGADITFEALNLGAIDFVPKRNDQKQLDVFQIKTMLLEKVKNILQNLNNDTFHRKRLRDDVFTPELSTIQFKNPRKIEIIIIGSSTGGPGALEVLLSPLPSNFPIPIVIAQHMPENFTHSLTKRLSRKCLIPVVEVVERQLLENGKVYLGMGGRHIVLKRTPKGVWVFPIRNYNQRIYKPSVDMLFSSAAEVFGAKNIGIILTGMGRDGLEGVRKVKQKGGIVIAQDQDSSIVYGMPKAVREAGLADVVLPVNLISQKLVELLR